MPPFTPVPVATQWDAGSPGLAGDLGTRRQCQAALVSIQLEDVSSARCGTGLSRCLQQQVDGCREAEHVIFLEDAASGEMSFCRQNVKKALQGEGLWGGDMLALKVTCPIEIDSYWLSCPMIENIGRNIPATMVPTMAPRKTIISGSMAAVRLSTASSTSRS